MDEALTCRTFSEDGREVICTAPARWIVWGHLYEKRDKGPKCSRHLPAKVREQGMVHLTGLGIFTEAIYAIPDLAEHDRQVAERALRDAADAADLMGEEPLSGTAIAAILKGRGDWLRASADAIAPRPVAPGVSVSALAGLLRKRQPIIRAGYIVGCECGWTGDKAQRDITPVDFTEHQARVALGVTVTDGGA